MLFWWFVILKLSNKDKGLCWCLLIVDWLMMFKHKYKSLFDIWDEDLIDFFADF